jgi:hypothetical protein
MHRAASCLTRTVTGEGGSASVSTTVAVLEDAYTDADLFETVCQIRGDELDDAGTYELVHHTHAKATAYELALGSFTRRKLKQLPIWDIWLASEWKQLDAHQKQEVYGVPCPAPPGATVLRSHWNYIIKPCGTRRARVCCDGSKRAAPELRFTQTYASCIDQPCMRLFFALSAAMGFVVMGADCTNAYANSLSPTQATYVRIDDAYADWNCSRHGKEVDRSLVLPVLKASQGHPEAGALWEKHINKILDDLDIVYTTHTSEVSTEVRSAERSSFCAGKSTTSLSLVPILPWPKV